MTLRDRDSLEQVRIAAEELSGELSVGSPPRSESRRSNQARAVEDPPLARYCTQAWILDTSPAASATHSAWDSASSVEGTESAGAESPSRHRAVLLERPLRRVGELDPSGSAWKTIPVRSSDSAFTDQARSPSTSPRSRSCWSPQRAVLYLDGRLELCVIESLIVSNANCEPRSSPSR